MRLRQLLEAISKTGEGDTAVVGWGRGMGHKGHMMLASSVITKAKDVGGDPYFVVSRTVGKDDPITPDEKLAIYKKVFPQHGHIFQSASDELPDLTRVLSNLNQQGYKNAVVVLGADQVKAFQYLKQYNNKPDKSGNIAFNFDNLDVISRQETNDPSRDQEGPRATPMRDILNDPNASPEEQFKVWRDAMSPEVSDDEVRDLMAKAKERMAQFAADKKAPKKKKESIKELSPALMHRAADELQRRVNRSTNLGDEEKLITRQIKMAHKAKQNEKGKLYKNKNENSYSSGHESLTEQELQELAPLIPAIAAGARFVLPHLSKLGPLLGKAAQGTGKVAAKTAGQVAKGGAEIAAKNAPAIGAGAGIYSVADEIGKAVPRGVDKVYSDVKTAASDITAIVGKTLGEKSILDLATTAVKYSIPLAVLLAVLYGGKKAIDSLFSNPAPNQAPRPNQAIR